MPEVEVGTKRSNEFDEYGEVDAYKKSRSDNMNLRLLLVGRYCGAIIGKAGENINRLRKEFNVEISMHGNRTVERVLIIDGSMEDCINVVKELLPACSSAPYPVNQKCSFEINLLVHTEAVGVVIGKGGAKIKEIREESSGKIKVYQECLANSNERVIALGGDDEEQILAALKIVLCLLREQPRRSGMQYDPANKPSEILGSGIGSGMMHMQSAWGNNDGSGGDGGGYGLLPRPSLGMGNNSEIDDNEFLERTSSAAPSRLQMVKVDNRTGDYSFGESKDSTFASKAASKKEKPQMDADEIFGHTTALTLKEITDKRTKEYAKVKIQEILYQAQFGLLNLGSANYVQNVQYQEATSTLYSKTPSSPPRYAQQQQISSRFPNAAPEQVSRYSNATSEEREGERTASYTTRTATNFAWPQAAAAYNR